MRVGASPWTGDLRRRSMRLLALLLVAGRLVAAQSGPADISDLIRTRGAALGTASGTIVVDQPGRLGTPVTLRPGQNLLLRAPIEWDATVRLEGRNAVRCEPAATITAHLPAYEFPKTAGMLLLATGVSGVTVEGCHVTAAAPNVLLAGYPVSDVTMTGNILNGLTLLAVNGTANPGAQGGVTSARLTLNNNTVAIGKGGEKTIGLALFYARKVTASGNQLSGLGHGVEWWGGNSGVAGANLGQVTAAGEMTFTGNVCKDIAGACIWGSMGSDVVMQGNTADGCGDVCFDTEGGLRTQIVQNTATRCKNGCAAVFFFSDQTTISGNHFRADAPGGGLILIKNASANPAAHDHLTVANNELTCVSGMCRAVYQEAVSGLVFRGNAVSNGIWQPVGFARSVQIEQNHFVFNKVAASPMIGLAAPAVIGGTTLAVVGNTIDSEVAQPAGSVCLAATWSDFNAADTQLIAGNICGKNGAFSIGLSTVSAGKNPGVAGIWIVSGNRLGGGTTAHPPAANERFYDLGECGPAGCQVNAGAVRAVQSLPGCGGAAPRATARSVPVCLPGGAGWTAVPLAR